MRRLVCVSLLAVAIAGTTGAAGAQGASRLIVRGHGFGHGIGLSQYGALGFAQHGFSYQQIIDHYYQQTSVMPLGSSPDVRVLLRRSSRVSVTGASGAGTRRLSPTRTYSARSVGGQVGLYSPAGRRLGVYDAPLRFIAPSGGLLQLRGATQNGVRNGSYRGALEVRPDGAAVLAINDVGLEDYLRGVVAAESPSTWPAEALEAQAVVARSYAVTTNVGTTTDGIDQYADTRSQMYEGVHAETATTDAAVAATRGQVVAQGGKPVTTYFFSTSGGHTENIEFSFLGALPEPWLKGVDDPFDDVSPKHDWGPLTYSATQVRSRLKGLLRGGFRGITVLQRGVSPRIVRAEVVGTGGVTATTGPELRRRFGLDDTWAAFTFISSSSVTTTAPTTDTPSTPSSPATGGTTPSTGGTTPTAAASVPLADTGGATAAGARPVARVLQGTITRDGTTPATKARLQVLTAAGWQTVRSVRVDGRGRYRATVRAPGRFRIVWAGAAGPAVDVR